MAVAIAFIGTCMAISAQTPTTTSTDNNCQQTENCCKKDGKKGCKGDKKNGKGHKHDRKGMKPGKGHFNPFEGIELTQEQQNALKAMRQDQKNRDKANREEAMKQRDEKIQTILTPEQYQQYKQNVEKAKANRPTDGKQMPARDNMRRGGQQK